MISSEQFNWQRPSGLSRRLYIDYAKKIAKRGGAVGLWSLRNNTVYGPASYAAELMRMADAIGPEHVMFGTDLDGVGSAAALDNLRDMRKVADALSEHGADDNTLKAICFDNYARCLKAATQGRQAS
jgi:membrane dipeptidase